MTKTTVFQRTIFDTLRTKQITKVIKRNRWHCVLFNTEEGIMYIIRLAQIKKCFLDALVVLIFLKKSDKTSKTETFIYTILVILI